MRAVLAAAAASVDDQKDERSEDTLCRLVPFGYDLGEDVIITISHAVDLLTWDQLGAVLRGLQLYQITGKRYRQCYFEIHDSRPLDTYTLIGSGSIFRLAKSVGQPLLEVVPSDLPNPVSRRSLRISPGTVTSDREIFRIPHSELILVLHYRGSVSAQSVEAVLLTADSWVARKISIFGQDAPTDFIIDYRTGDDPLTRLLVFSTLDRQITWGELKVVIDGLWLYLIEREQHDYTFWEIYDGLVDTAMQLGYGTIVNGDGSSKRPVTEFHSTNLTLKRSLQISPPQGGFAQNETKSLSAYSKPSPLVHTSADNCCISPIAFEIPGSEMTLEFQNTGHRISPLKLNALLLVAAVALDEAMDNFGKHTPSDGGEYKCSLGQGVEVWLVKVFRSPQGYLTYGNLRTMIAGLQIYMVIGKHPQAVRFRVLYGPRNAVLGHGEVGKLLPSDAWSNMTAMNDS